MVTNRTGSRRAARAWVLAAACVAAGVSGGCSNARQGALSGAAVGSLTGLAIGSMTGEAGTGAAIGAVTGLVGGAVIGDQNRRRDEAAMAASTGSAPESPAIEYEAAPTLSALVGSWSVGGSVVGDGGAAREFTGTATATSDRNYFLRLEIRVSDPTSGATAEGTSVIGQDGGNRLSMVNSFSTSPEMRRFEGEIDSSGSIMTFRQVSPAGASRRVVIRVSGDDRWTAQAWDRVDGRDQVAETLTFTRSR